MKPVDRKHRPCAYRSYQGGVYCRFAGLQLKRGQPGYVHFRNFSQFIRTNKHNIVLFLARSPICAMGPLQDCEERLERGCGRGHWSGCSRRWVDTRSSVSPRVASPGDSPQVPDRGAALAAARPGRDTVVELPPFTSPLSVTPARVTWIRHSGQG